MRVTAARKANLTIASVLCCLQVTTCARTRTAPRAAKWSACSCWCSRSACAGRPGGTSALPTNGCPTGKPDAATATAACPARAPWTWTLTIQCGSQTSRPTWSPSLSWPEQGWPLCGAFGSVGFTEREEGADWQEVTQNCVRGVFCQEEIKVLLVTDSVSH